MAQRRCISCMKRIDTPVCPHCGYPTKQQNEEHQLPVGYTLRERYQIGKVLGQGGFGITYLAWDNLLEQQVAVKEFYPRGSVYRNSASTARLECVTRDVIPHYEYTKERFLREARALVQFRNIPEIVDILDFVNENNTAYIIMEYVKGASLEKYIARKGGKLSVEETFRILKPVMEALASVHKGGIIHRDISPDNIILDPMGGAKLLDFGAVRSVEKPGVEKALTHSTEAILKHGFAPMEQYNSRGSLGPWTDEYAMCATIWYCLTGTVPPEAALRMTEGVDPDWSSIPDLAEYQQKALEKGFSSRPKDRYVDMNGLIEALFSQETAAVSVPKARAQAKAQQSAPRQHKPEPAEQKTVYADGGPSYTAPSVSVMADEAPPSERKSAAPVTRRKPRWIAVLLVVAVIGAMIGIPRLPANRYKKAETLMDRGDYSEAKEIFEALGDYRDSEAMAKECENGSLYAEATDLMNQGIYREAVAIFESLGEYRDSPEKAAQCNNILLYTQAEALMNQGNYSEAAVIFESLGDYQDSHEKAEECNCILRYAQAEALMNQGNYSEAAIIFESLGDYQDSHEKAEECNCILRYAQAEALMNQGNYSQAAVIFESLGTYRDSDAMAIECTNQQTYAQAEAYLDDRDYFRAATAFYSLGDYRDAQERSLSCWSHFHPQSISSSLHTVGLKGDGTVVAVGYNKYGQCDVSGWQDIVSISSGVYFTVGLKADGTVVAAGNNNYGQCDVSGWRDIVAISAGYFHTVGLKADGTVVAVGQNNSGQCDVSDWQDIVAISAGYYHTVGLKADGTVVAVGHNNSGQCDVSDWRDIVTISAGDHYTVGIKADGTVVATGIKTSSWYTVPFWRDIAAISAGYFHTVGLKADGTLVAVGSNEEGQCDISSWRDIVAISASAGTCCTVGLKADGTVVAVGSDYYGQCDVSGWRDIRIYE